MGLQSTLFGGVVSSKKKLFFKVFFAQKYIKIIFFNFFKKIFLKSARQNDMLTQKKINLE
jgi:hypothetical protein